MNNVTLIKNYCYALVIALLPLPTGCDEDEKPENQTQSYSSDVVKAWLDVQVSMLFAQTGNPFGFNPSRYMAYCGVALYESVVPGMPSVPVITWPAYRHASHAGRGTGAALSLARFRKCSTGSHDTKLLQHDYGLQRTGCI